MRIPEYFVDGDYRAHVVEAWVPVVALAGLGAVLGFLMGWSDIPGLLIYIASTAAFRLYGLRDSIIGCAAPLSVLVLVQIFSHIPMSQMAYFYFFIPVAWWAVAGSRSLIAKNAELAEARDETAALKVVAERERVARDVHDLLGHSLTVLTIKAQLAARMLEPDSRNVNKAREELQDIEDLARAALTDVRAVVGGLRIPDLEVELAGCRSALRAAGIHTVVQGSPEDIPREYRELVCWVLRESVTNVVRHSGAERCTIVFETDTVLIRDNGSGFNPVLLSADSTGLAGLRDRVEACGAELRLRSTSGTSVEVELL